MNVIHMWTVASQKSFVCLFHHIDTFGHKSTVIKTTPQITWTQTGCMGHTFHLFLCTFLFLSFLEIVEIMLCTLQAWVHQSFCIFFLRVFCLKKIDARKKCWDLHTASAQRFDYSQKHSDPTASIFCQQEWNVGDYMPNSSFRRQLVPRKFACFFSIFFLLCLSINMNTNGLCLCLSFFFLYWIQRDIVLILLITQFCF